jgi:SAM-dependent methyltransferase
MIDPSQPKLSLAASIRTWFAEESARSGLLSATKQLVALLWEFLRDSLPSRRQRRYGDVDYDWDYRVDTTSATVGWRERLLGLLHSPYQPTEPSLFHTMLDDLKIDFEQFTFIDIGSGKGRALLMASDYPFRRIVGVELLPALHRTAQENIARYKSDGQKCLTIESVCCDACQFKFPPEPMVLYLFSPLPESGFIHFIANLELSLRQHPRPSLLIYHNPLLAHVLMSKPFLKKILGTHQYSVFAA